MKKIIATTLAALMLAGVSAGAAVTPAAAAGLSVHISSGPSMHHPKHWHQRYVCRTTWRHHHRVKLCTWVPFGR